MIVVIPVCHKDCFLAIRNLEFCIEVEGSVDFDCFIVVERGYTPITIVDRAKEYFKSVEFIVVEPWKGDQSWPIPMNWMWQSTAREMVKTKQPWLWWEPDATPLKAGWLTVLRDAYKSGKRPFAGAV